MTDTEKLIKAMGGIVVGYVFLHFDINLMIINIFPDWLGYVAIVHVLDALGEEEPSANLLRPLGGILVAWEFYEIAEKMIGFEWNVQILGTIVTVISLYFHFQLLTNIATIAERYEYPKYPNLIKLRTARTLLITAFAVMPLSWEKHIWLVTGLAFVGIVIGVWICIELNDFKKALSADSTDNRLENEP